MWRGKCCEDLCGGGVGIEFPPGDRGQYAGRGEVHGPFGQCIAHKVQHLFAGAAVTAAGEFAGCFQIAAVRCNRIGKAFQPFAFGSHGRQQRHRGQIGTT